MAIEADVANRIWDLLVRVARASKDQREDFVSYVGKNLPSHEFRFQGNLGFGGKFYHARYEPGRIDCYPEDLTPDRKIIIEAVNATLAHELTTRR